MIIPLRNQAADEQGAGEHVTLRSSVAWDSGAARAADARRILRALFARAAPSGRSPVPAAQALDAQLVVSELITNAILHAPGPCGLNLQLSAGTLTITVWDTSLEQPKVKETDPRCAGGHGLRLVHTVSDRVIVALGIARKQITAQLHLTANDNGMLNERQTAPA
ncbi:ATP-binding protein [Streptomyces bobili]|uniref:ATP-binding protein n=1 Tax=Streptomyces bobili TaxID=67280 RepID=UPI0033EE0F00